MSKDVEVRNMSGEDGGDSIVPLVELFVHPDLRLLKGFDLKRIEAICAPAVSEVMALAREGAPLCDLDEVEVTLVSDQVIADVHVEFMDIEGATDVITFDHGEILISTETAAVQAAENGNSVERETALYVVHGLLHLAGYTDKTEAAFKQMASLQEQVLQKIWG